MASQYTVSLVISIVHFIIRYIETHVIKKDPLPVKTMMREAVLVFISCMVGFFLIQQLTPLISDVTQGKQGGASVAFTDNPSF